MPRIYLGKTPTDRPLDACASRKITDLPSLVQPDEGDTIEVRYLDTDDGPDRARHRWARAIPLGEFHVVGEDEHMEADLYVCVYGDGAVYGSGQGFDASTPRHWRQLDEPFELAYARAVPSDVAEALLLHGTSEQVYADGYEAFSAAAPYFEGA